MDGHAPESSCRLGVADIARISSRYLTVLPRKAACAAREWRGYIPARTTSEIFMSLQNCISNLNLNLNSFISHVKGKIRHPFSDKKLSQPDQRYCAASWAARSWPQAASISCPLLLRTMAVISFAQSAFSKRRSSSGVGAR